MGPVKKLDHLFISMTLFMDLIEFLLGNGCLGDADHWLFICFSIESCFRRFSKKIENLAENGFQNCTKIDENGMPESINKNKENNMLEFMKI